jgi:hypothetical protein
MFTRLDFYANAYDMFGGRDPQARVMNNVKPNAYELMFKDRVSLGGASEMAVSSRMRPELIKELKNRGVTEINGKSVEEFITIAGRGVVDKTVEDAVNNLFEVNAADHQFGSNFENAVNYEEWRTSNSETAKMFDQVRDPDAKILMVYADNSAFSNEGNWIALIRNSNGTYMTAQQRPTSKITEGYTPDPSYLYRTWSVEDAFKKVKKSDPSEPFSDDSSYYVMTPDHLAFGKRKVATDFAVSQPQTS